MLSADVSFCAQNHVYFMMKMKGCNAAPDEKGCWKLMHPAHALLSQRNI